MSFGTVGINDLSPAAQKKARAILAQRVNSGHFADSSADPLGGHTIRGAAVEPATHNGIALGPNSPARVKPRKPRRDREHVEQVRLFELIDGDDLLAALPIYAVPNFSGLGAARHGGRLKAEGRRPGVLDVNVDVARGGAHGLRIEMKIKPNTPSPEQREWMQRLDREHFACIICYTGDEAYAAIKSYLSRGPTRRR